MNNPARTLIVIPAWNEEATVAQVIKEVHSSIPSVDCVVVSDGSTDETVQQARRAGAEVLALPFNLGVGGAMRLGFKYALANHYQNVVQLDADGQHDPQNVPQLLAELHDHDIVIGARFAGEESYSVRGPRRWAMWILSTSLSKVTRTHLTDTTSGFKACGPRAVRLFADHYPAEYLGDTIEALVIAARSGCTVTQVPVSMRERMGGIPSHNPLKSALYLARAVMALIFALISPKAKERH